MDLNPTPQDARIADFLSDYADGVAPLETLLLQYDLSYQDVSSMVQLTDQLRGILIEVSPAPEFVASLYRQLIREQQVRHAWWSWMAAPTRRVQSMSNRTKIAAGIGGITLMYLTARSLSFLLSIRHRADHSGELAA